MPCRSAAAAAGGRASGPPALAVLAEGAPDGAAKAVYEYSGAPPRARRAPDLAGVSGVQCACVGGLHSAVVAAAGAVICAGENGEGDLGAGDYESHEAPVAARLPWPAASVHCGFRFSVALRRGGAAVCSWGVCGPRLGRKGAGADPAEVEGLPPGDPVIILEAGGDFAMALTASGAAFGWGWNDNYQLALGGSGAYGRAVRIPSLSGRGVIRLACGQRNSMAETDGGDLLIWGLETSLNPAPLPPPEGGAWAVALPLRSMAGAGWSFALADARGCVWCVPAGYGTSPAPKRACLPEGERAVRVGAAWKFPGSITVALTDRGELWDCSDLGACRGITTAQPELPRGLMPFGGGRAADRILLVPDICGGRPRLCLFARIAVRRELPVDPLRVGLVGFMVHSCYITGPEGDPFGWPTAKMAAPAAEG